MTHTYQINGMTCGSCEAKVKSAILLLDNVQSVEVSKEEKSVTISMDKHISLSTIQEALTKKDPRYVISAKEHNEAAEQAKNWFATYRPILLIFTFITIITGTIYFTSEEPSWHHWMGNFMAGFFLTFSFFKFLDLNGFANSYAMYDIIAKRIPVWGYLYAFIEFSLGFSYLLGTWPLLTNVITFLVMTLSIIGVLLAVFNKQSIQCACLGAVFNLPMSTVTIIEDALMIAMSGVMIYQYL